MTSSTCATLAITTVLALASHQSAAGQSRGGAARIDSAAMLTHVRVLAHDSLQGRRVGTPGGLKAREYIRQQFVSIGLEQLGASHLHEFALTAGRGGGGGATGAANMAAPANVVGLIRGLTSPTTYIVVTAHYDHLGPGTGDVFNGADDNASGSGALLAMARYFRQNPPRHSIIFLATDAEERGLQGARAFVANPPVPLDSIIMNVNMDMVGRNDKDELYVTGTLPYPYLKQYIERVQPASRVKLLMGHDVAPPGGPGSDNWTNASDHGAFNSARIPFLYFGVEDHPDYHRATDEFERLQPGFYVRAIETVLDVMLLLDGNGAVIRAQRR